MRVYERMTCRLCGGKVAEVLRLTPTPIANSFPARPDTHAERIPLNLMQCGNCQHVQCSHVPRSELLYGDYKYSTPDAVLPHLQSAAQMMRATYPQARRVLEIGSNNGLNLAVLAGHGFDAVGVDPAAQEAHNAVQSCFTPDVARWMGRFDIIVANNVLAHIDDLDSVFEGVRKCLAPDGVLIFEVQYLRDMVLNVGFDMIYHEHHDYHALRPLAIFARKHGLVLTKWQHLNTHGGSIRVYVERTGKEAHIPDEAVDWLAFHCDIEVARIETREELQAVEGRVASFGAAAKACTLLHHFGLTERIDYCVDDTREKQGRYIAGTEIQVCPAQRLEIDPPAALFLTAWNYEAVIRGRFPEYRIITPWRPSDLERAARMAA